ncbi:MAG: PAS domain-containing protein [Chlorobiaceae bacterium]|nr:PAS domain-containing protein [Chlorobiaceae bacterium]
MEIKPSAMPKESNHMPACDILPDQREMPLLFYKALLDAIPGSVYIMDARGGLVGWNNFTRDVIFGKPESEMHGTDSFGSIHPDDRGLIRRKFLNILKNGVEESAETRVIYHGKTDYEWRLAHGRRIMIDGEPFVLAIGIDITNIKRIESELKKNRMRLNQALGAARAGVWEWDLKSGSSFWSDELWALYGLKRSGAKASHELWISTIHPEDRQHTLTALYEAKNHAREVNIEYRVSHPDGSLHWLMARGMPVRDDDDQVIRYIGTIIDITERRQTEEELKKSRAQLLFALEKSGIGWWDLDLEKNTTKRTLEHDRIFGYDSLLTKWTYEMFLDHVVPEEREQVKRIHEEARLNKSDWSMECRIRRKDGEIRWIWSACGFMLDKTGKPIDLFGIVQDITERKNEEQEREKLQSQLHQSQKMELIGQLAGGIAHDINNVLTSILGHTELVLDDINNTGPFAESLQQVHNSAIRAAHLIHQLLAFARKQTMVPKILELDDAVGNLYPMLLRLIGEHIDFAWHPDGSHTYVLIDPSQLDQIVTNLCVNSRDAISGSGSIAIETALIHVDEATCAAGHPCRTPGDYARLSVIDSGCGIEKSVLPHIFEPFFTTKEVGKGTGLGLSTVYGIVKQNNGYLECLTKPGKGTTVNVYLLQHTHGTGTAELRDENISYHCRKKTILVVEEEPDILKLIKKVLQEHGYTVRSAPSAEKAIQTAEELRNQIDLVVTDTIFSDQISLKLMSRLLELNPDMKTLFMSGYCPEPIEQLKLFEDGINFIQKPFGIDLFLKAVQQTISTDTTDQQPS